MSLDDYVRAMKGSLVQRVSAALWLAGADQWTTPEQCDALARAAIQAVSNELQAQSYEPNSGNVKSGE